jgi:hypothetical protein
MRTIRTSLELGSHDALRTEGNVMRRAHGRVCRSDDGHAMRSVGRVQLQSGISTSYVAGESGTYLGVPYSDLQRSLFDRAEEDRLWPLPLEHDEEESGSNPSSVRTQVIRSMKWTHRDMILPAHP